jgi:hypothetical protein
MFLFSFHCNFCCDFYLALFLTYTA